MNNVESQLQPQDANLSPSPRTLPRRSFLRRMGLGAVALAPGAALLSSASKAFGEDHGITEGDAAILRFLAAAEILESDLWEQYWELGGVPFGEHVDIPRGESPPHFSG